MGNFDPAQAFIYFLIVVAIVSVVVARVKMGDD